MSVVQIIMNGFPNPVSENSSDNLIIPSTYLVDPGSVRLQNNWKGWHVWRTGADPGRGESGSSHGQIFSTLEYFELTFLKILD